MTVWHTFKDRWLEPQLKLPTWVHLTITPDMKNLRLADRAWIRSDFRAIRYEMHDGSKIVFTLTDLGQAES